MSIVEIRSKPHDRSVRFRLTSGSTIRKPGAPAAHIGRNSVLQVHEYVRDETPDRKECLASSSAVIRCRKGIPDFQG